MSRGSAVLDFECQPLAKPGVYTVVVDPRKVGEPAGSVASLRLRVVEVQSPVAPAPAGWNAIAWNESMADSYCWPRKTYGVWSEGGALRVEELDYGAPRKPPLVPPALVRRLSADHARGIRYVFELDDGYVVLFNHGEWGGGLEFYPHVGGRPRDIVIGDPSDEDFTPQNVLRAQVIDGALYVLQGIGHLGLSAGQLARVWREHGHFTSHVIARFDSAPIEWMREPDGSWLILTRDTFWHVDERGELSVVAHPPNSPMFYASSAVRMSDGTFYFGTRGGVLRLTPTWRDVPRYSSAFLADGASPLPECPKP